MAVISRQGQLQIHNLVTGKSVESAVGAMRLVGGIAFCGAEVVSGDKEGNLRFWDICES